MPRVSKLASQIIYSINCARGSNPQKKQPSVGPNMPYNDQVRGGRLLVGIQTVVSSSGDWFPSVAHADD